MHLLLPRMLRLLTIVSPLLARASPYTDAIVAQLRNEGFAAGYASLSEAAQQPAVSSSAAGRSLQSYCSASGCDYRPMTATPGNQGQCGSGWAFAVVHAYMDQMRLDRINGPYDGGITAADKLRYPDISVQDIMEKSFLASNGCRGGYAFDAYLTLYNGYVDTACKAYASSNGKGDSPYQAICVSDRSRTYTARWDDRADEALRPHAFQGSPAYIKNLLADGVALAEITVPGFFAFFQSRDVYTWDDGKGTPKVILVELVGWGLGGDSWNPTQGPRDYWIVKNSWGTYWGNGGYALIDMNCTYFKPVVSAVRFLSAARRLVNSAARTASPPTGAHEMTSAPRPVDASEPDVQDVLLFASAMIAPICSNAFVANMTTYRTQFQVISATVQDVAGSFYRLTVRVVEPACVQPYESYRLEIFSDLSGNLTVTSFIVIASEIKRLTLDSIVDGVGNFLEDNATTPIGASVAAAILAVLLAAVVIFALWWNGKICKKAAGRKVHKMPANVTNTDTNPMNA